MKITTSSGEQVDIWDGLKPKERQLQIKHVIKSEKNLREYKKRWRRLQKSIILLNEIREKRKNLIAGLRELDKLEEERFAILEKQLT
tara:strand:+ start:250 stop:510 length:261 start_codon:yes stop_codon:yes gene_type:complete